MSNDYNDKSWTERTNWILTVIALALVAILSIGLLCALFIRPQEEEEDTVPKDGAIISEYNFRHESGSFVSGEMTKTTTYYKDLLGEELAERYLMTDKDTVLWRVAACVEGKYSTYTREDSYLMYSWPAAGDYANLSLSEGSLIF